MNCGKIARNVLGDLCARIVASIGNSKSDIFISH